MKLLGIDYGDAKVGLAVADTESGLALPYKILKKDGWNDLIIELQKICKDERIERIVIGLPVGASGNESEQARRTREFAKKLDADTNIPIDFIDERYSTQEAQKLAAGKDEDDLAAMLVLQSYLERGV